MRIFPPNSLIDEYLLLIEKPPQKDIRLGELLIQCGTLTQRVLDEALRIQRLTDQHEPSKHRPIGEILVTEKLAPAPVNRAFYDGTWPAHSARIPEAVLPQGD